MTESELLKAVAKIDGWHQANTAISFNLWYRKDDHPQMGGLTSAELFERNPYTKSRNAATEAVMRWCGNDMVRQRMFSNNLFHLLCDRNVKAQNYTSYYAATATATELCEALVAAVEEYNRDK